MVEKLRDFLLTCPFLNTPDGGSSPALSVDYLSEEPLRYAIDVTPSAPWVTRYVDGGGVKQLLFVFRSLEFYGKADIEQNTSNLAFYERFSEWLAATRPTIPGWVAVEALTEGYFQDVSTGQDKAMYQIQCRVKYSA